MARPQDDAQPFHRGQIKGSDSLISLAINSTMSTEATIRVMDAADVEAVADLFAVLAREFISKEFEPAAQATFLSKNNATAIRRFVANGYRYHVAELNGEIVGFVGVRDNRHLYHLFVAKSMQGRGLGRSLWQIAKEECLRHGNRGAFTVNSSRNAIPIYERFGFVQFAEEQNLNGVLYNPMRLE